ncbi:MAG: hypothetical protein ACK6DC_10490 [Planctomycetota bacterium]|jgi:hypothetical protein
MTLALPWDPEMESPATLLVVGGGPVGIEAALYARFLGYFVSIFESRRVAHRMLDWHDRPLALPVSQVTTSLGHAAIAAQNPEYKRPDPDRIFTGREYAEEYLLPLAKTDLLFDDIHFLSPVIDVSRRRTHRRDPIHPQERCNDEFRVVVQGQHRGPWTARGDCLLDCRGHAIEPIGMGPGGGLAIGERDLEKDFLLHAPSDRKYETKHLEGKRLGLIGEHALACQCVADWLVHFAQNRDARLVWMVRPSDHSQSDRVAALRSKIESSSNRNILCIETLGVESITKQEDGSFRWNLLKEDDSTVELETDVAMRRTGYRYRSIGPELHAHADGWVGSELRIDANAPRFVTAEPGYYALRAATIEEGAGAGLPEAFEEIRRVFALIGGREDLDLYRIVEQQSKSR